MTYLNCKGENKKPIEFTCSLLVLKSNKLTLAGPMIA